MLNHLYVHLTSKMRPTDRLAVATYCTKIYRRRWCWSIFSATAAATRISPPYSFVLSFLFLSLLLLLLLSLVHSRWLRWRRQSSPSSGCKVQSVTKSIVFLFLPCVSIEGQGWLLLLLLVLFNLPPCRRSNTMKQQHWYGMQIIQSHLDVFFKSSR